MLSPCPCLALSSTEEEWVFVLDPAWFDVFNCLTSCWIPRQMEMFGGSTHLSKQGDYEWQLRKQDQPQRLPFYRESFGLSSCFSRGSISLPSASTVLMGLFALWLRRQSLQSVLLKMHLREEHMPKAFGAKFAFKAFATSLLLIYYFSRKDQSFIKGRGAWGSPSGLFFVEDLGAGFSLASPGTDDPRWVRNTRTFARF